MLRMMQDDLERRQKQAEEEKQHKSVEDSQANVDIMERSVGHLNECLVSLIKLSLDYHP